MKVTRVVFYQTGVFNERFKIACSIALDDQLLLKHIRLGEKDGKYFLVMPSLEDMGVSEEILKNCMEGDSKVSPDGVKSNSDLHKRVVTEFYHPVNGKFYSYLRDVVATGYENYLKTGNKLYIPDDDMLQSDSVYWNRIEKSKKRWKDRKGNGKKKANQLH